MSEFTPEEEEFIDTYVSAMSGGCTPIEDPERTAEARRGIADVKADAWDEGLQAGWEECRNPDPFVNDWWDSKAPNPHRIEGEA